MFDKCLKSVRNLVFPPRCVLCAGRGQSIHGEQRDLCAACEADLVGNGPACVCCAEPLPSAGLCSRCLKHPPPQSETWAPFRYRFPLNRLVSGFKFNQRLAYGRLMAQLFAERAAGRDVSAYGLVIPVPLHRARQRERGFNQAEVLARALPGAQVDTRLVKRLRPTLAQSTLALRERRRNLRGAFDTRAKLRGERILLIDDVMTSGSTIAELARVLRKNGAGEVHAWVFSRAPIRKTGGLR